MTVQASMTTACETTGLTLHAQVMDLADAGTNISSAQSQEQSWDVRATPNWVESLDQTALDEIPDGCTGDPGGSGRKWISAVLPNEADLCRGCFVAWVHFFNLALGAKSVITSSAIIFHYPSPSRLLKNSDYDLYSSLQ